MRILMMLSGCVGAVKAFARGRGTDWAAADDDEINEAMHVLLERRYGWHTRSGPPSGSLYHRRDGTLVFTAPGRFYPATSWSDAMKATEECVDGGIKVDLQLRRGRCGPRHLCVQLLTMCGADRPVPEVVCEECDRTARRFKKDAEADGWLCLRHSRPLPNQKRFQANGWGFVGRCASCGPRSSPAHPDRTAQHQPSSRCVYTLI